MTYEPSLNEQTLQSLTSAQRASAVRSGQGELALIAGQYQVLGKLGAGGMGCVYKCRDMATNRIVAVKTLPAEQASNAKLVQRFQIEARAVAQLEHPNIVRLHTVAMNEDVPCLVMEYCPGMSLADYVEMKGSVQLHEAIDIALQILDGLEYAHAQGIIHRDLKPCNVIVNIDQDGKTQLKIVDFGIAKVDSTANLISATTTGEIFGSPAYMSPEQAMGQPVTARTDQYSFGCMLFELLCGQPPFVGSTPISVIMQHLQQMPASIEEASFGRVKIPERLQDCLNQLLEKQPECRFESLKEVRAELQGVRNGVESQTYRRKPGKSKNVSIPSIQWYWVAGPIVAVLIVAVSAFAFSSMNSSDTKKRAPAMDLSQLRAVAKRSSFTDADAPTKGTSVSYAPVTEIADKEPTSDDRYLLKLLKFNPQITELNLTGRIFTPIGFEALSKAHYLKELVLDECGGVNDSTLHYLANLPLEKLSLRELGVTQKTFDTLKPAGKTLKHLDLAFAPVSNCAHITNLPKLESVWLTSQNISDHDLIEISKLSHLKELHLEHTKISSDLKAISKLPLKIFSAKNTPLGDKAVSTLAQISTLENLNLDNTEISDISVPKFAMLKKLRKLSIKSCSQLTPPAITKLRLLIPYCNVIVLDPIYERRLRSNFEKLDASIAD